MYKSNKIIQVSRHHLCEFVKGLSIFFRKSRILLSMLRANARKDSGHCRCRVKVHILSLLAERYQKIVIPPPQAPANLRTINARFAGHRHIPFHKEPKRRAQGCSQERYHQCSKYRVHFFIFFLNAS